MKVISCDCPRSRAADGILRVGNFTFEVVENWAKWPAELAGVQVLNSAWYGGILYAVTGKPDYPIVKLDRCGNYLDSICAGLFKKSHSIKPTPAGTLLVADAHKSAHVIREITPAGEVVRTFGTPGVPGDSGYDFDAYAALQRAGKTPTETPWNKNPESNARIDSIVRRGVPFCRPCSMFRAEDGESYAADGYGNCAVHRFSPAGELIQSWGSPGSAPGSFRVVHDVLIDEWDRVWIADRENARVQAFTRTGELLAVTEGKLSRIGGIWADGKYLYIAELDGGLTILDLDSLEVVGQAVLPKVHGITGDEYGGLLLSTNTWSANNILYLKPALNA